MTGHQEDGRDRRIQVVKAESSRVGDSLRAARTRVGWSREALAYHSGVSWAAIAQIESGRRRDVRASSLSALARALNVTVDYLVGTPTTIAPQLLEHRVLTYGTDEEFLATTVPFLLEGVERSHCALAVTSRGLIELLRDALGGSSDKVEFADSVDWYRSPSEAFGRYRSFVTTRFNAGAPWIRVVGEPIWKGRSPAEITAWGCYESLVNIAFASSPATIICPYDVAALPEELVDDARRTHPEVAHGRRATASATYRPPEDLLLDPHNAPGRKPAGPRTS